MRLKLAVAIISAMMLASCSQGFSQARIISHADNVVYCSRGIPLIDDVYVEYCHDRWCTVFGTRRLGFVGSLAHTWVYNDGNCLGHTIPQEPAPIAQPQSGAGGMI